MMFYLGTHVPTWLNRVDVPLFIARQQMPKRKLPRAINRWALDSGGFGELQHNGEWTVSEAEYADDVLRYQAEVGQLDWAAPQDWMCEPMVIAGGTFRGQTFVGTHLSVAEHQHRTVANLLTLRALAPTVQWTPVLQGWTLPDYARCIDLYQQAGVDLWAEPLVGVGSVCRRQRTGEIRVILAELAATGLPLHGFGLKLDGLLVGSQFLTSADSLAWAFRGRKVHRTGCECELCERGHTEQGEHCGGASHKSESNCEVFALRWRQRVLDVVATPKQLVLTMGA